MTTGRLARWQSLGDDYRIRAAGAASVPWLALAERAAAACGLRVLDRGPGWLALCDPRTDPSEAEDLRRWGGHVYLQEQAEGLAVLFHVGRGRHEVLARMRAAFRAAGFDVAIDGDD